ncbi:glycoside hydrolase [Anaeromyces robustus]|uniref:alpha-amylase n=1 Tax=Anaeromyces robustus TaxID=1754192 RepID=A0A1Y1WSV4_9FUNG|nr:glycoside hydrolase [Anaeromyces robustus]|eukprot:ORX76532.1 glycoside hydrolase [Anaeromyces robustus]
MKLFNKKRILSSLIFTLSTNQYFKTTKAEVVYHTDKIEDGTILHAFSWSFNTIKEKLLDIKNSGYTAVQTSAVQRCIIHDNGNKYFGNWQYAYQPISQEVGNYIVGSEEEFKSLCSTAKKYGIKIIADVVLNHMTPDINNCEGDWKDPKWYHGSISLKDFDDRYAVTQGNLVGLKDLKTQDPEYQERALKLLQKLLNDGASGFRYDAAKHIELPDDYNYGGNFWPFITKNNNAEFQYGELLQGTTSRDEDYAKYLKVTASNYGYQVRKSISNNNLDTGDIGDYQIRVNPSKLITWVESHDNYSNEGEESVGFSDEQIKFGWALIASRKSTTPLFFSRPLGGGGKHSQFPNKSFLGDEGDPLYKDETISSINFFRNAMVGENEFLRNPYTNGHKDVKILMIERGNKGIVIINLHEKEITLQSETHLAPGEYENQNIDSHHINDNNKNIFKVSNDGKIQGILKGRSVTILYKNDTSKPKISIEGYSMDKEISFKTNSITLNLMAFHVSKATYSINNGKEIEYVHGNSIKIGENSFYGDKIKINLKGIGEDKNEVIEKEYIFLKKDPNSVIKVYFQKSNSWGTNIHSYIYRRSGITLKQWPGEKMKHIKDNIYMVTFDDELEGALVIFNDNNNNQSPGVGENGFKIINDGLFDIDVYFEKPNEWNSNNINAYIYYKNEQGIVTEEKRWPGLSMLKMKEENSKKIYSISINSKYNKGMIIFNDGRHQSPGGGQDGFIIKANGLYNINGSVIKEIGQWPGTEMKKLNNNNNNNNIYYIEFDKEYNGAYIIFNNGNKQIPSPGKPGFIIYNDGLYNMNGFSEKYNDGEGEENDLPSSPSTNNNNIVTIYYYTPWSKVNIHYQIGSERWTSTPGIMMSSYINGYKKIIIDLKNATTLTFVFNNNENIWDNNHGKNYYINTPGNYIVKDGKISSGSV